MGKTTLAVYLVFSKLIFFKTFIIFLTYNQINNSNIWFAKVTIILIPIVQVLFSVFFSKKTRTLVPLSFCFRFTYTHYSKGFKVLFLHIYIYIYIHIHLYIYIYTISLTLRKIQVFSNFPHRNVSYPDYFCVLQQMFIYLPFNSNCDHFILGK